MEILVKTLTSSPSLSPINWSHQLFINLGKWPVFLHVYFFGKSSFGSTVLCIFMIMFCWINLTDFQNNFMLLYLYITQNQLFSFQETRNNFHLIKMHGHEKFSDSLSFEFRFSTNSVDILMFYCVSLTWGERSDQCINLSVSISK